jgi:hypothetical protein
VKALGSTTTCTVPTYGLAGQGKERKICIERTIMIWIPARAHTEPLLLGRFSWLARKKKVTEYCYWWYKKVHFPRAKRGRLPHACLYAHSQNISSHLPFYSTQPRVNPPTQRRLHIHLPKWRYETSDVSKNNAENNRRGKEGVGIFGLPFSGGARSSLEPWFLSTARAPILRSAPCR